MTAYAGYVDVDWGKPIRRPARIAAALKRGRRQIPPVRKPIVLR